jgi:hypothetical protein
MAKPRIRAVAIIHAQRFISSDVKNHRDALVVPVIRHLCASAARPVTRD